MQFVNAAVKKALPFFNRHPHTFDDVERIAKKERVTLTICEYSPDILGYYCIRRTLKRRKRFIIINSILDPLNRTFIGLHELGHHFLHVPITARQWFYCRANAKRTESKYDCEADYFALIAMVPFRLLIELEATAYEDLPPEMIELCLKRKKLWEKRGV